MADEGEYQTGGHPFRAEMEADLRMFEIWVCGGRLSPGTTSKLIKRTCWFPGMSDLGMVPRLALGWPLLILMSPDERGRGMAACGLLSE